MSTKVNNKEQVFRQISSEKIDKKQESAASSSITETDRNLIREQNNLLGSLRRLNLLNQTGKLATDQNDQQNSNNVEN